MIDAGKKTLMLAALSIIAGCSAGGGKATDSSTPKADSVTAATVGRAGGPPAGETLRTVVPPVATKTATGKNPSGGVRPGSTTAVASTRPHLTRLTPASGSLGSGTITVEVSGDRFTATGNRVFFGSVDLGELPSTNGAISFAVPRALRASGEAPPAAIQPGTYRVYLVNSNGTSDTLSFRIKGPFDG